MNKSELVEEGYSQIKMTKAEQLKYFPKRLNNWKVKYDLYFNGVNRAILCYKYTVFAKVFNILMLPIYILLYGVMNKDLWNEYKEMLVEDYYSSDTIYDPLHKDSELKFFLELKYDLRWMK